ncbi:pantetheine-phosphate adenylyltransferase [Deltaproteobacteria bacterium TL4]
MTTPRIAIYPTSANPPTWGHGDILLRAAKHFDHLYWSAAVNPTKQYIFTAEERLQMMNVYLKHYGLKNVTLDVFTGSTIRYAQQKKATALVKGLRNYTDFQVELQQAVGNQGIDSEIETFCLFGTPALSVVSSSLVRELALLGENIEGYVHPEVAAFVGEIILRQRTTV